MDNISECKDYLETLKHAEFIDTIPNPISGEQESNKRVVDLHDRKGIEKHLSHFMQHSAARNVNPGLDVILDFLYSKKTPTEKDDFVRIERLIEMVKDGQVFPNLIVEVLEYALSVEKSAIEVLNDNIKNVKGNKHLEELQSALALRLSLDEQSSNG